MYHIAIVEDEISFVEQLQKYLFEFQKENNIEFKISVFRDGEDILKDYKNEYDAIFLDIEMPKVNGMEAAEQIRDMDEDVVLMFITNMAQYAIQGYSVGALDFVMKPINYYTFSMKLRRVLKKIDKKDKEQQSIILQLSDGIKKLDIRHIYYVEVQNRMLYYYTSKGTYSVKGTLQSVEQQLENHSFAKCNHWYLVNLKHVKEVRKNIAVVGCYEVEISRRNRTVFLKSLTEYLGGNA